MNKYNKDRSISIHSDEKVVCVTGASGFIGRKLIEALADKNWQLRVLSRRLDNQFSDNVQIFLGDLTDPRYCPKDFLKDCDILFHCAGEIKNIEKMNLLHIDGTQKLITSVQKEVSLSGKIFHWIQLSSCGAYGPPPGKNVEIYREIYETTETAPVNEYERTKTRSDELVIAASGSNLFFTILRPSNVIGASMKHNSFHTLIKFVNSGYFFFIGRKDAVATYVHIDDVVKAMMLIAINPKSRNEIFNISSDCSWIELINKISSTLNVKTLPFRVPYKVIHPVLFLLKFFMGKFIHIPQLSTFASRTTYSTKKIETYLGFEFNKTPHLIKSLIHELAASKK
jgi:nucleoside-diphosphate-sugar epimerase